jgi:hypothetical protein
VKEEHQKSGTENGRATNLLLACRSLGDSGWRRLADGTPPHGGVSKSASNTRSSSHRNGLPERSSGVVPPIVRRQRETSSDRDP